MKKIITTCTLLFSLYLMGQNIQTGEGSSSIILQTANIGFDIKEASISFKINNFSQAKLTKKEKSKQWVYGVNVVGKNQEGFSSIFSGSSIVPSSSISSLFGYSYSNSYDVAKFIRIDEKLAQEKNSLLDYLDNNFIKLINKELKKIDDDKIKAYLKNIITTELGSLTNKYNKLEKALEKELRNMDPSIAIEAQKLYNLLMGLQQWQRIKEIDKTNETNEVGKINTSKYWKFTFYGHYGLQSQKFNIFKGWNPTNIADSFTEETFRGSNGGFGANLLLKSKLIFGFKYTYEETNNLNTLSTTDYKITTTNSDGTSTGSTQISKTAYPDTYNTAYVNNYDFDVIYFFNLGKKSILIGDLYTRINKSTNQQNLVSTTDLGVSCSFFKEKGKFIGGFYIEVPDINQNIEKRKPISDQNLKKWHRRFSFGLYANYNLSSLIGGPL